MGIKVGSMLCYMSWGSASCCGAFCAGCKSICFARVFCCTCSIFDTSLIAAAEQQCCSDQMPVTFERDLLRSHQSHTTEIKFQVGCMHGVHQWTTGHVCVCWPCNDGLKDLAFLPWLNQLVVLCACMFCLFVHATSVTACLTSSVEELCTRLFTFVSTSATQTRFEL